jgi:hypothetical protein
MSHGNVGPVGALLVGSVPLTDADEVMMTASKLLGRHLRRMPDGETGERSIWIAWQAEVFRNHPDFEVEEPPPGQYAPLPRFRLREGADVSALHFEHLGYADAARSSYPKFHRHKKEGEIPADMRFQVSLPTPLAPVSQFVAERDKAAVEPAYEQALLRELAEIVAAIPHDELSIQWDVAVEMGMWEGLGGIFFDTWFDDPKRGIVERLARAAAAVPDDVEVGFHLCYGDFAHEHFMQPHDSGNLVEIANMISAAVTRPIQWLHMPVPRDRTDEAYFTPLRALRPHPESELYLGLVHYTDGEEGTRRRIEAARRAVERFGVATECGLGRRPPETIEPLMRIHAAVATPVRSGAT